MEKPLTPPIPRTVDEIDWSSWKAVDLATLLFVVRQGRILLIRKKRGLGAGKINGPGGRLEAGEEPHAGALREVEEEILVTPRQISEHGELLFQFVDGYSIHVWVFRADDLVGQPSETDEAIPLWFAIDEIPYGEMWEDDRIWLPVLLAGGRFKGCFVFDGDTMLDHRMIEHHP